ncbi:MAG: hypothetical protein ABSC45_09510 [Desulfobaccales bacterium]|jgi:hypothetical protein
MVTKEFTIRLGQDEIGYILDRKENLDHHSQLWDHMSRYRDLGWTLAVIGVQDGVNLKLDLSQPKELWWKQLADLGLDGVQVNLAVRTGRASRLLVLEVNKGKGTFSLDLLGDWRAQCVAELVNGREQHYYALPSEKQPPASFSAGEVSIYGEGGLVLAPTSIEPETGEPWRWVKPPWVSPPQAPKAAVWQFLREQQGKTGPESQEMLSWEEVYQAIALQEGVLKALRAPSVAMGKYYRDILIASLSAGLRDRRLLLGLLWHAPHGDARTNEERWQFLKNLLVEDQLLAPEFGPESGTGAAGLASPGEGRPGPEPQPLAPARSNGLAGGGEDLILQLPADQDSEPSRPQFEQSVYGQYFKLLATLGEQVIAESCRQETILSGLEAKVTEMDRVMAEIERCFASPDTGSPEAKGLPPARERGLLEFPWAVSMARPPETTKKLQEVKSMVKDFLSKNPDLAEDQDNVQMVLFCLKNYVSIDPDFAGMSFQEKLEEAGRMARGFLKHSAKAH